MFRALGPYGHSQLLVYDFMQTRSFRPHCHTGNRRFHTVSRRSVTACLAAAISSVLLVSLSGCTMPRYVGRAESEQTLSDCERSYDAARHNHDIGSDAGQPLIVRYMASISARSQWIEVAATCIDRFGEGVLRAAQHTAISYDIARRFAGTGGDGAGDAGTGSDTASDSGTADDIAQNMTGIHDASSLADVNELDILPEMLTGMALAEDRAGFTVEILAARGSSDATISLADEHKATGERLISLASGSGSSVNDPRRKIYEVGTLLANVNEIVDPTTGLRASTFAVAEITCAREEIAAVTSRINDGATGGNAAGATSDSATDGDTAEAPAGSTTGGSHTEDSSTDGSTTEPTDRSSTESTDKADHTQSMRILANLVSSHVTSAFTAGYPSFDHALFVS